MEARAEMVRGRERPAWLLGLVPLLLLGAVIAIFVALDAPGLERRGVPIEQLVVDRTVLRPGEIELHVRNDGPDPVSVRQAIVNDGFAAFTQTDRSIGRLGAGTVRIRYPWIEGESYEVRLLTATGATVEKSIHSAAETPQADAGFYGLMALVGLYVGIIPVAIGMLWLPWVRLVDARWVRFLLAVTLGLLGFLAIDAVVEGLDFAGQGAQALGGGALVWLGAVVAYLALAGVDAWVRARSPRAAATGPGFRLALLVSIGIGLHNLGEGLAIGSAYAIGSLALGASLIVGFALHNTTEGLAIVAPVAQGGGQRSVSLRRLAWLGVVAGGPVILGTWVGASAFDTSLAAFMLGLGAGAIAQVVVQIAPTLRDRTGRLLDPLVVGGLLSGLGLMYATGLLISI
jgi:ZIP family zinc transporter